MVSFEDFLSLSLLNSAYWAIADGCSEQPVETLFARAAHLKLGSVDLRGGEAIHLFFSQRALKNEQSARVTRHISSAFVPAEYAGDVVSVRSTVAVFAGNGELPIPSDVPSTIADVEDVFVRSDDGKWLFQSRFISPIFVGASAAAFAR
ncbi:hypothetical protein FBY03_14214 [Pseudomonas sp. SJZ079]|uniref:nuclear transport factor 2 family protein n=1 Tax=Pseudomonas sp. SJZ079 TaxID=2572887 RepID=UPI00119967F6|nr:nuclear transport factor 2 family protein [Pseudomonas sp. SJZ079]TWC27953.1 hypothetical protein FBY03_14214 [Pseudomonas sp. SJZ079]